MRSGILFSRKIFRRVALALVLLLALFANLPVETLAAGASLYFSPSSGTRYVGDSFAVYVLVNTGGNAANAYKALVSFPTDKLRITSVSSAGSICSLWIPPAPNYSNSSGTANFECGSPTAYNGPAGRIGIINFSVRSPGTATVQIASGSQVKKADGAGTEILATRGSATFTLKPPPTGIPTVSSSTHPDQNSWYSLKDVALSWSEPVGTDGFSYTLDQRSGTVPDETSEGTAALKTYSDLDDGIWYFHVRAHSSSGWSSTAHFRIQIDTTPPDPFEITSEPPAENVTEAPRITAAATDRPSGIDHYELSMDGGDFETVPMPYQFPRIEEGNHTIAVRAVDRAGNYRDSYLILHVTDVEEPIIEQPADGSYLPILEQLTIIGQSPAGLVELYLNGEFIYRGESDGRFTYTYEEFLRPGTYRLAAIAVTENGLTSSPTEVVFTVDPRAIRLFGLTLPGWLVYGLLLGIILFLLLLLIRYIRKSLGFDRHVRQDLQIIEGEVEKEVGVAEHELERAVDQTLKEGSLAEIEKMKEELEKKIEEAEGDTRRHLEEQLDKIRAHHGGKKKRPIWPIVIPERRKKKKKDEKNS